MVCPITTNDRFFGDGILLRLFYVVFFSYLPPRYSRCVGVYWFFTRPRWVSARILQVCCFCYSHRVPGCRQSFHDISWMWSGVADPYSEERLNGAGMGIGAWYWQCKWMAMTIYCAIKRLTKSSCLDAVGVSVKMNVLLCKWAGAMTAKPF